MRADNSINTVYYNIDAIREVEPNIYLITSKKNYEN